MQRASLCNWFNSRTLRERIIVALALAMVLILVSYLLIIDPQLKRQHEVNRQLAEIQQSMADLASQETIILARRQTDPDQKQRQRIDQLQSELNRLQQQLESNIANLVSPQQMVPLLKDLLGQQKSLTLVSLRNLSPALVDLGAADNNKERPKLYKHRLEMELSGNYRALLDYLAQLQNLPRSVVWETVEIETEDYPKAFIHMQVYTLSLTEGWIGG